MAGDYWVPAIRVPTKIAGHSSAARAVSHRRFSWVPGAGTTPERVDSHRRDGRNLDQKRLLHETIDDQQRIRRITPARKQPGKFTQPERHELRDVLRVHEIGGELDHAGEARALRLQGSFDIGEYLPALRVEVGRPDDL